MRYQLIQGFIYDFFQGIPKNVLRHPKTYVGTGKAYSGGNQFVFLFQHFSHDFPRFDIH
ncbi:hypothetical protein TthSNM11_12450 [Thermus thermophilus]|nr:hypothetical protein TthSNM11_12450 [Thermus thermophilus]BDG22662.1 hypothetical protein TthSNM17_23240 [Thermus thermophilus]